MISKKLRILYLVSVIFLIVHDVEEYFTRFYNTNSFYQSFSNPRLAFIAIIILGLSVFLIVSYVLLSRGKFGVGLSVLLGLLLIYEFQHIVVSLNPVRYTPGLVTALAFPILGFIFWRELLTNHLLTKYYAKH